MPLYLTKFSYTPETWARLIGNPGDRRKAAQSYIESVGGKLHGFWYAFGTHDGYNLLMRTTRARPAIGLIALLALAACGGDRAGQQTAVQDSARFALLTSGPVSDAGWYAGGYEGLLLLRDSLGAAVSHQQTRTPSEFDEAFRAYGNAGYDIVFAHGFEYQDAAIRAGEMFPDMFIVVSGGGRVARNVVPVTFTLEQGSYLAGMAAGGFTRSGIL